MNNTTDRTCSHVVEPGQVHLIWYRCVLIAYRVSATDRRERNPTVRIVLYTSLHQYYYYTVVAVAVLAMWGGGGGIFELLWVEMSRKQVL